MASDVRRAVETLFDALEIGREKRIDFMAGAVTYYTFFALAPFALLLFLTTSFLGGEELATRLLIASTGVLPETGRNVVQAVFQSQAGGIGLIGVILLVWASLQLFRSFDIAFTEIYGKEHPETLVKELENAFVAIVTLSMTVFFTVSLRRLVTASPLPSSGVLWTALTFAGLTVVFLPLYYVFTDVDVPVRGLLPGAMLAAAGWTVLQALFGVYKGFVAGSLYGAFGGVLLLTLWLYVGNILVLLGAVVNFVHWRDG